MKLIVENVPGATGSIGMTKVANAEPDGYTIGMGTSSTLALIAQGLTPLKNEQFAPIARVTTDPLILLVPAKAARTRTLESFLGPREEESRQGLDRHSRQQQPQPHLRRR